MERSAVRRRDRLILEARDEIRQLGREPTARAIDDKVALKDPGLYVKWRAAQDATRRRRTILQVLRDEKLPKNSRARPPGPTSLPPAPPPPPPLVWPLGMRQRKAREPKFKLPWLLPDNGGSEKVFLECLGDRTLLEVSIVLEGQRVGYAPALRPGAFIEVEWERNPKVKNVVTWGGKRDHILNQESMKDMAEHLSDMSASPAYDMMKPIAEWTVKYVASVEKVMPPDLESWKEKVYECRLEVHYTYGEQNHSGTLRGTLLMNMERLWFRFKDEKGHDTPIH